MLSLHTVKHGDQSREDPSGEKFQFDARAVRDICGVDAWYAYEGDSMSLLFFLTETLKAHIVHIILSQSSDSQPSKQENSGRRLI